MRRILRIEIAWRRMTRLLFHLLHRNMCWMHFQSIWGRKEHGFMWIPHERVWAECYSNLFHACCPTGVFDNLSTRQQDWSYWSFFHYFQAYAPHISCLLLISFQHSIRASTSPRNTKTPTHNVPERKRELKFFWLHAINFFDSRSQCCDLCLRLSCRI